MRKGFPKHALRLVSLGFMLLKWLPSVTIQSRPRRVIIGVVSQQTMMKGCLGGAFEGIQEFEIGKYREQWSLYVQFKGG